jgi:hypothetical protein
MVTEMRSVLHQQILLARATARFDFGECCALD